MLIFVSEKNRPSLLAKGVDYGHSLQIFFVLVPLWISETDQF